MAHSLPAAYIGNTQFTEVMEAFFDSIHQNNSVKQFSLVSSLSAAQAAGDHYWLFCTNHSQFQKPLESLLLSISFGYLKVSWQK